MAKNTSTNIVTVWNWLVNILENDSLSATEQIVLVHVIAKFNRNMWQPTKINPKLIAAAISKDARTVSKAIDKLIAENILSNNLGVFNLEQFSNGRAKFDFTNKHDDSEHPRRGTATNTDRVNSESDTTAVSIKTSDRSRKLLERDNAQ